MKFWMDIILEVAIVLTAIAIWTGSALLAFGLYVLLQGTY